MSNDAAMKMLRWAYLPECENPPQGWSVRRFTEIAKVIAGQSPPSDTYNDKGDGLPFLQGNADFSFKYPVPSLWCSSPQKTARAGDTLISVRAPVGEVNRADCEYAIGRGLAAIRANADSDFLYYAMQRWRQCLLRVAQGTTFDAVTARHFARLFVAIPPPDEQAAIARILDSVDKVIELTREVVERTRTLKSAVIHQFFSQALGETAYANRPAKRLPTDWELIPTENLLAAEPKNGVSPNANSHPPGIFTFSIAAIRHGKVNLENKENLKYAQLSDKIADAFRIDQGDVLIVRGKANPDLVGKAGRIDRYPDGCIYPDITKRRRFPQRWQSNRFSRICRVSVESSRRPQPSFEES